MPSDRDRYPSDLTDEEWAIVAPLFSKSEKRGRTPRHDLRRVLDGCFYILRGGIAWRMMPHERCFAWLLTNRRLVVDYECLPKTDETFIHMAMSRILLRRLAKLRLAKLAGN